MWAALALLLWAAYPQRGRALLALAAVAGALPYVVYGQFLKNTNPIFAAWPPQSDINVGDPLAYLLWGHLLMLPFVIVAALPVLRRWRARAEDAKEEALRLGIGWIVVSTLLMYLPVLPHILQRVYYGSFIPFGILAVAGLAHVVPAGKRLLPRAQMAVLAMMIVALATVVESIAIPVRHLDDLALYFPRDEAQVLQALRAEAPSGGKLVMNSWPTGLYVPALSGDDTYLGFPFETLDQNAKQLEAQRFFSLQDAGRLTEEAGRLHIDYVLWGRYERDFGGPDPGQVARWPVAYASGDARIYRVTRATSLTTR
jgi:hypothetical protein